jgi:hypothetical protein
MIFSAKLKLGHISCFVVVRCLRGFVASPLGYLRICSE